MTPTTDDVRQLGDARRGLQGILNCVLILWAIAAIPLVIHVNSLPTVPICPWLGDFFAAIVPGLPPRLAQLAAIYPLPTSVLLFLAWLLRRGMARLADAQAELMLQQSIRNSVYRILWRAKFAAFMAKLRWPAVVLLLAALTVVSLDVLADEKSEGGRSEKSAQHKPTVGCGKVHGNCRLAEGESVRITIRSDRVNDTGIWLEAGAIYTLRLLELSDWADADNPSEAQGFHFERNVIGMQRFWWAEWLRPLPDGRWFQLVGRVDRKKPVFPVLGKDPCTPFAWAPQHDGELVLMVNDVILSNNTGSMTLKLSRTSIPRTKRWHGRHAPAPSKASRSGS